LSIYKLTTADPAQVTLQLTTPIYCKDARPHWLGGPKKFSPVVQIRSRLPWPCDSDRCTTKCLISFSVYHRETKKIVLRFLM